MRSFCRCARRVAPNGPLSSYVASGSPRSSPRSDHSSLNTYSDRHRQRDEAACRHSLVHRHSLSSASFLGSRPRPQLLTQSTPSSPGGTSPSRRASTTARPRSEASISVRSTSSPPRMYRALKSPCRWLARHRTMDHAVHLQHRQPFDRRRMDLVPVHRPVRSQGAATEALGDLDHRDRSGDHQGLRLEPRPDSHRLLGV